MSKIIDVVETFLVILYIVPPENIPSNSPRDIIHNTTHETFINSITGKNIGIKINIFMELIIL